MKRMIRQAKDESGIALVMALGMLLVLAIVGATIAIYSVSSTHQATYSAGKQSAYALAESGINDALSVLANGVPTTTTLLGDDGSGTVTPFVCQPSGASFSCNPQSGSNVLSIGGFTYSGTFDAATYTWTISATGMTRNPNGAAIKKTVTRVVTVSQNPNGPLSSSWNRIYQDDSGNCLTVPDGSDITGSLGTRGDLCLVGASVLGSTSNVDVGGNVTLTSGNPFPKTNTGTLQAGAGAGWTNSQNIYDDDSDYATAVVAASGTSPNLLATGYGLSIPSGSAINGIQVKVFRFASAGNALKDLTIQLLKAGVPVGSNKATSSWWQTGASSNASYGANNDVWGTTWTGDDVNNAGFGVEVAAQNASGSSATGYVDAVQIIVTYTPPPDDAAIGVSGTPVAKANIAGTCNYNSKGAHSPCSSVDNVFAGAVSTSPSLSKPTVDFSYWYDHAAPGPKHPCDVSTGTPPTFDNDTSYNKSVAKQEFAPSGADYSCIAKDSNGNTIGQLSWDHTTHVLTVSGTMFFDGSVCFCIHGGYIVHYQGRATIYESDGTHFDAGVCAGGSGATSSCASTMSSWDPTQNLLVFIVGGLQKSGNNDCKFDENTTIFQGAIWVKNKCQIAAGALVSGPVITDDLDISSGVKFYSWPSLGWLLDGETQGATLTASDYSLTAGQESG
jgi:hypothetical protein